MPDNDYEIEAQRQQSQEEGQDEGQGHNSWEEIKAGQNETQSKDQNKVVEKEQTQSALNNNSENSRTTTQSNHSVTLSETATDNGSVTGYVKCMDNVDAIINVLNLPAKSPEASDTYETTEQCGCACFYPRCLQPLAMPVSYLCCICSLVFIQSLVVSGYSSGVLTTIEKRYDLWTRELGYIISSYDMVTMICGIIISYIGERFNRAKLLGRGAFIIALGCVVFSLPYFIGSAYTYYKSAKTDENPNICNHTHTAGDTCRDADKAPERWALAIFMIAFMIIGVGASPVYSLGATYLYDNVQVTKFPVYSSLMYAMGALGPAVGFLVAAACTQVWVHPHSEPPAGLSASDAGWVGAWWMGFLAIAVVCASVGIPLLMFPRALPQVAREDLKDDKPTFAGYGEHIKEFPRALWQLLCNPTWLLISLVMVVEQSIGTGFNRFIAKYFQVIFNMSVFYSSIIMGVVLIPAAVLGIIAGGILMKRLNLDIAGISRFLLVMNVIPSAATGALLALGCRGINLAGVTDYYGLQNDVLKLIENGAKPNLTTSCNSVCHCDGALYEPVCGNDKITYYSPCHAGCESVRLIVEKDGTTTKNFTECSCIWDTGVQSALAGRCDPDCGSLVPFLILLFILVFCTTLGQNPVLLITLRCVDSSSRSFALGMQNLLIQLIAYIPAPIYFGQIFDSTCILWSSTCEGDGACQEHNTTKLPMYLFGTCLGFKAVTIILLVFVYLVTRRQHNASATYDFNTTGDSCATTVSSVSYSTTEQNLSVS